MCNANADVESLHNTIEEEFFDLEEFSSKISFWDKISSYQLFYNFVRPNFSKKGQTPMQIIENERKGKLDCLMQKTVDLDQLFRIKYKSSRRGQYLPELPVLEKKLLFSFKSFLQQVFVSYEEVFFKYFSFGI